MSDGHGLSNKAHSRNLSKEQGNGVAFCHSDFTVKDVQLTMQLYIIKKKEHFSFKSGHAKR